MAKKQTKILAIDDHPDNLVVLKALVNDSFPDAVLIAAGSGKKGFELCQSEKPDVVLLDIVMPGMDGYEVCTKIKSDISLRHIPVIMVTANRADKESRVKALDAGADAFLPKPVDDSELKAQIRAMLRIKESEDQKKEEKHRLEDMVLDRTEALENELADRKKAENKLIQSLDKITKNRQAIMNLMEDLKVEIAERKIRNRELRFINTLAFEITQLSLTDNINVFLAGKIKEFSEASVVVSLDYIPEKKAIQIKHIDTNQDLINKVSNTLGKKFFETLIPIPDEKLEFIIREYYAVANSISELSFGQMSDFADKVIKKVTGIDRFYAIASVTGGKFLGTTMLGFKKDAVAPSKEVLVAFARLAATTIQNRRSEEKLKKSEEEFRLLIENQGEGVGIVDLDEKFVFVNPAAEHMFGVKKGGLLSRNLLEFIKPDQISIINEETKKRLKAEKSSYEINIICPNGEQRTLIITATPQFTNEGILSGTFGVFRDITERKQMEQKIRESETYYRTLIDISPDGIIITDLEGNVTYGSIKALEIFGVPPGENVVGSSILRWLTPDSHNSMMERFMEIMKGNIAPETREYKLRKYDGSPFWGEISSSPLSDSEGHPLSMIIVYRDISDRKKAELELIKSKEKAEEGDRLKTAFLHNISHEIRTPMNAIFGFSALLSEPDLDKENRDSYIEIITQSSNQLLSVVNDIIEISNIEAGILKLYTKTTNLNMIMSNLHKQYLPKTKEKNINFGINLALSDDEANIETDENKLFQVLSGLLSNANKFTSSGVIGMGYSLKEDYLEFYVSDTGIGIQESQKERIFDRFYQVENSTTRIYEGTGLGLSIAKAYVELLSGRIWLSSEPGSGTTFYFTIPYSSTEPTIKKEKKTVINEDLKKYENKIVLIAEDEENNYRLLVELLSGLGLKLIHAGNGKEAVDICDSNEYIDLVFMDIKMPVMDGYEAASIIKKKRPSLPIIAQTAFAYESDRENALSAGCDDYISKPLKKSILIEKLGKFLVADNLKSAEYLSS